LARLDLGADRLATIRAESVDGPEAPPLAIGRLSSVMVADEAERSSLSGRAAANAPAEGPSGVAGWLLVLSLLLVVWQPVSLGLVASSVLGSLTLRGLPVATVLLVRIVVTAAGIGAGLALLNRRPGAVSFAKVSLVVSAATDAFTYSTPYFPSNRVPGDTILYVVASLAYYAIWLAYLFQSKRVRRTFASPAS
jgi:hypothetical protein